MNKLILIFSILYFSTILSARTQEIRLGGGLIYGSQIQNVGLNFRGDVKFNQQWSITPHFSWFFNKTDNFITNKWNALNIDGHYYFKIDPMWFVYPVFGVNLATVAEKVNSITFSNSEVGVNLGIGTEYFFDRRLSGFGEIKYVVSDADQLVVVFGVLFRIYN